MNPMRFVGLLLAGLTLLPSMAWGQPIVRKDAAAIMVYNCLKTGQCNTARMLNVSEDSSSYYEASVRVDQLRFEYVMPVNKRRLEVHFSLDGFEVTLIDSDLDGVVDHVIDTSTAEGVVWIYGKETKDLHKDAQGLYRLSLDIAITAFALRPTASRK